MLETVNGDPDFMNTVITGDESWVYGTREEIMQNATDHLRAIPKEDFQRCFQQWQKRWE
ncbi:Uncharacterized protein FKW44_013110, partial [Caligus rogercresseyi]